MLGLVFTEFMDMVEEAFPPEVFDHLIEVAENDFDSAGDYTAVGKYEHGEMLTLVTLLSERSGVPVPDLVEAYGRHLFGQFHKRYPDFFEDVTSSMDFLAGIEERIHSQVRKLYPNADLPVFEVERNGDAHMVLDYSSNKPFAKLANGLIQGCMDYFKDGVTFTYEDTSGGEMTKARFVLTKE